MVNFDSLVTEEVVIDFLNEFREVGWYLSIEFGLYTVCFPSIGIKRQSSSWYHVLSYLVDKHDLIEVDWCNQRGIEF